MTAVSIKPSIPAFCEGIQHFGEALPDFDIYGKEPAIAEGQTAISSPSDPVAVYQTLLAAEGAGGISLYR